MQIAIVIAVLLAVCVVALGQMWMMHLLTERLEMQSDEFGDKKIWYENKIFDLEFEHSARNSQLQQDLENAHSNIEFLLTQIPLKEET